jgi:adenylyltransferase/sulfurtransferase
MLTDAELERYARHIVLKEVGGTGQLALSRASVAMVGAGGLGSPALQYLAAAGVGRITIIDDDRVSLSNLQRQTLFGTADLGARKADIAAVRLADLNPHVAVSAVARRLTPESAEAMLRGHDVIADGSDSFATRAAVNRAAVALRIPLVSAAIGPFEGQVGIFAGHRADAPCWACFAGTASDRPGASCADTGVLGAVAGSVGALLALEVIRLITGFGTGRVGQLWLWDALTMRSRDVRVPKDPACPVCS